MIENAPLGVEDAARRDDVEAVFVDVRDLIPQPDLHTRDLTAIKIIVGRKGSGKTHMLRYIEEAAKQHREVIFSPLDDNAVPARLEKQFSRAVDHPNARSRWSKLWRVIFCLTVLSRFTNRQASLPARRAASRFLVEQGYSSDGVKANEWHTTRPKLISHFEDYYFPQSGHFRISELRHNSSPASLLHTVLDSIYNIDTLDQFIDSVDISSLEADIASLAKLYRPFHLIIDGVDDISWRQPRTWLDFQVGLFDAVFYFAATQRNSEQVVVTVAIRNFVFQAAAQSPHIDRIRNLLSLNWSPNSAIEFLNRRLHQISSGQFADAVKLTADRPLAEWLGFDSIAGIRRKGKESVESYFLRHTRLSPRNLIKQFNMICEEKNRCLSSGRPFGPDEYCEIVNRTADKVAELMLKTAAEEIIAFVTEVSSAVPSESNSEGVLMWVASALERAIRDAEREALDWKEYEAFLFSFVSSILTGVSMLDESLQRIEPILRIVESILWRSNVIAFWDRRLAKPGWTFSWTPREDSPPRSGDHVGFHSSLIGKCGLGVSEHGPVF